LDPEHAGRLSCCAVYLSCANANPLLHPVAVSTAILVTGVRVAHIDYPTYFDGNKVIHLLLGPATVALAVPLYRQIKSVQRNWFSFICGALLGSASAVVTAMALASLLGASHATILSMAAKSVTMPIAIGLTEKIGGTPSLTSALVMLTGIMGAVTTQIVLKRIRITDPDICGFALGVVAHGIGTSRALQVSQDMGAFAGLAMGLAGVLTALLVPVCLQVAGWH
jgi:predicted murein hydrolase (TIGR00659 family)